MVALKYLEIHIEKFNISLQEIRSKLIKQEHENIETNSRHLDLR